MWTITTGGVVFVHLIFKIASNNTWGEFVALTLSHIFDLARHPLDTVSELETELPIRSSLDAVLKNPAAEGEGYSPHEVFNNNEEYKRIED